MGKAAGAAAAALGSRCSWELRRRGGGMQDGLCRGRRVAIGSWSRGGNCGQDRLRRLPGKMAVGLAAPLSLLRRSGLPGEPAPNSAVRLWQGPAAGPRRSGRPRLSGLYKKLRRAREETAAAAVRLAPLPHPVLPPPRPAPPPPGPPALAAAATGRRPCPCPPGEGALLLPDMVQSGGRRAMAP